MARLPLPHRFIVGLLALLLFSAGSASAALPKPEAKLLGFTNAARSDHGLKPLVRAARLRDIAEEQARVMAANGLLEHSGVVPPRCSAWAENVGLGPTLRSVHRAFMASPAHRANVLGPYGSVGLGVVKDGDTVWVAEVFCKTP